MCVYFFFFFSSCIFFFFLIRCQTRETHSDGSHRIATLTWTPAGQPQGVAVIVLLRNKTHSGQKDTNCIIMCICYVLCCVLVALVQRCQTLTRSVTVFGWTAGVAQHVATTNPRMHCWYLGFACSSAGSEAGLSAKV